MAAAQSHPCAGLARSQPYFAVPELAGRTLLLLGQTVAERLFAAEQDPVDQVIRINRVPFTVIGVLVRKAQIMAGWIRTMR